MMDRSTRALRRSTGYTVSSKESSSRALRAAQRRVNKEKVVSKRKSIGENDDISISIQKRQATGDQQKSNKRQQVRKKPLGKQDLESIGKRMRRGRSNKSVEGIHNVATSSVPNLNSNDNNNDTDHINVVDKQGSKSVTRRTSNDGPGIGKRVTRSRSSNKVVEGVHNAATLSVPNSNANNDRNDTDSKTDNIHKQIDPMTRRTDNDHGIG